MKSILAIFLGIITALLFVLMLSIIGISFPAWLPYLVGYISMESDLIKFDIPGVWAQIKEKLDK